MTSAPDTPLRLVLEQGRRWVFASAVDWPGWARRGRGEEAAIEALLGSRDRYAAVLEASPVGGLPPVGDVVVTERLAGGATTDFGAPGAVAAAEAGATDVGERARLAALLDACWAALDRAVAAAPAELATGPRGGGRHRDAIAAHVQEAERSYARKVGVRLPPRTPWPEQRAALLDAVRGGDGGAWPLRYVVRRVAWHVLDHAWEIEDRAGA